MPSTTQLDGIEVALIRDEDFVIVNVTTEAAYAAGDLHSGSGIPQIKVYVNDGKVFDGVSAQTFVSGVRPS